VNDTEQLIKEALGKLAERTPHPGPTLNALRRKHKRHRNVFLIATAGMAAVAVLIFAGLVASDRYTPNHNDAAAALMSTNGQGVQIKYTPHWLPDGYVESYRSVGDETTRVWVQSSTMTATSPTENAHAPRVLLTKIKKLPSDLSKWQEVSLRGLKAWVQIDDQRTGGTTADLVWQAQDALRVTVRGVPDVGEVARLVADSVRADANLTYLAPFSIDGKAAPEIWGSSPYRWTARLAGEKFSVILSTGAPAQTEGTPVTVRGKQGAVVGDGRTVVVQDSGLWLSVSAQDSAGAVEVADRVALQHLPHPDTVWIGGRQ